MHSANKHSIKHRSDYLVGKSSESVQCAITGPCLRMRQAFSIAHCTDSEDLPFSYLSKSVNVIFNLHTQTINR